MEQRIPGVEIRNVAEDADFSSRAARSRDIQRERDAYLRMAQLFVSRPGEILQELVDTAIALCGAESAGISLREGSFFRWVATGGKFSHLRDSTLPEDVSPCGICLQRNQPQIFDVRRVYYDFLKVPGPEFRNGLLIPWCTVETQGTIWVIPFKDSRGFDTEDLRVLQGFAAMAALCVRITGQQKRLHDGDLLIARAQVANRLAHEINNPLQSLTNTLFLASQKHSEPYLDMALTQLKRLSGLVEQTLLVPTAGKTELSRLTYAIEFDAQRAAPSPHPNPLDN